MTDDPGPQNASAVAERGRWLAAGAAGLAFAGAAVVLATVLATLEYDFEDGTLAPFEPARGAFVLVALTLVAGGILFSGVPWRRWAATLGYAAGAGWLLFVADFDSAALPATLVGSAGLGLATLVLLVPESVHRFFETHENAGGRLAQPLGPLVAETDLQRWIATIGCWIETGVLTPRERVRLSRTLSSWIASHPDLRERYAQKLERLAPPHAAPGPVAVLRNGARRLVRRVRKVS